MKRTRETIFRDHPEWQQREGLSGVQYFDGEDLCNQLKYDARVQYNKELQKLNNLFQQQMEEKRQKDDQERAEDNAYAQQTQELNRFRQGIHLTEIKKRNVIRQFPSKEKGQWCIPQRVKPIIGMAKEKRDKEQQERMEKLNYEKSKLQQSFQRGQKLPYP